MTGSAVPRPSQGQDDLLGKPPVHPAASEAGRLLCAGVHLHDGYRDAVIDQLYVQEQRIVAPSAGFDAARVLAHALRARRTELGWAAGILAAWLLGAVLTRGVIGAFFLPCVLLAVAPWIRGTAHNPPVYRRVPAFLLRWYGRFILLAVGLWVFGSAIADLFADDSDDSDGYDSYDSSGAYDSGSGGFSDGVPDVSDLGPGLFTGGFAEGGSGPAWAALFFLALIAGLVGLQRGQFAWVMTEELSRRNFPDLAADPAERAPGARFRRLRERIRLEQHAPLVMYGSEDPFCGSGRAYRPWNLAVELRPAGDGPAEPIDNASILRRIVPLLEALRIPSPHGSPEGAAAVRDRLRELVVDECVFLPVVGMPRREDAPYGPEEFASHRSRAVEEGGESRRHFLRVRVGGWNEEVVVTVFVRVHTQGGMLMLEVAPHVLMPVHPLFRDADRIAHRHRNNNWFGKAVWAATRTPASLVRSIVTLGRGAASGWKVLTAGNGGALADGPAFSVRELGSDDEASLFQAMDVNRYLKSVQDRVNGGVRLALREAGWQTDEFEQKIVNIGAGGVFIESARDSAIGIGDHNDIRRTGPSAPADPGRTTGLRKPPGGQPGPSGPRTPGGPTPGPDPQPKAGEK
ncbi:hypothetical protein EES43_18140 [Streptomyces sp. ADI96-02]|uniref:hypothetical protein n=1 Tax=Streptomyces sp. ADI96-02 TaxID=1522760 RepID=UPI000F54C867|nr:hypothetical protein [Streptomyces sp. ADI96-02]RPK59636.1 hypothetical protein EES43_18140 [Streptomyces sp. ADI96-02]